MTAFACTGVADVFGAVVDYFERKGRELTLQRRSDLVDDAVGPRFPTRSKGFMSTVLPRLLRSAG